MLLSMDKNQSNNSPKVNDRIKILLKNFSYFSFFEIFWLASNRMTWTYKIFRRGLICLDRFHFISAIELLANCFAIDFW